MTAPETGPVTLAGSARTMALLRELNESGPAPVKDLAAALGLAGQAARQSLMKLEAAGLVTHRTGPTSSGKGLQYTWSLTADGSARLQGRPPAIAGRCFSAIADATRTWTADAVRQRLGRDGTYATPGQVSDALAWLEEEPRAVITRSGTSYWQLTQLGCEAAAVSEETRAPVELRLQVLRDRQSGGPGMSRALAARIFSFAGLPADPGGDGPPDERRLSWSVTDSGTGRETGWEHDAGSGQWTLRIRVPRDGRQQVIRETVVADPAALACAAREITAPADRCPPLAYTLFLAIGMTGEPMTAASLEDWLDANDEPHDPGELGPALEWLARDPHAVLAPGPGGWQFSALGRAVEDMPEWEWADLGLCLSLLSDRRYGLDGMTARSAEAFAVWAGLGSIGVSWPEEYRSRWEVTDGTREIAWEPTGRARSDWWSFRVRAARPGGEWVPVRDVRCDLTQLAHQVREITGASRLSGRVVWKPGGYWALAGSAGDCDPDFDGIRQQIRSIAAGAAAGVPDAAGDG